MGRTTEDELVGMFYDAALGKASWNEVGSGIAEGLQGKTLNLFVSGPSGHDVDLVTTHQLALDDLDRYARDFAKYDLWTNAALGGRLFDRGLVGSQIVPDGTLRQSLFYNEFLRDRYDSFRFLGAMQRMAGGDFAVISTHRPSDAPDFDPASQRTLTRLLPHLGRSLEVRKRVQAPKLEEALLATLQTSTQGILMLNSRAEAIWSNRAGERMVADNDGLQFQGRRLSATVQSETNALHHLVRTAAHVSTGGRGIPGGYISITRPSGRYSYRCLVTPVGRDREALLRNTPEVLVFVIDPEHPLVIEPESLRALLGLTTAEAQVAAGLAMGEKLPAVARRLGVSHETARTLLARATTKTGSNGQLGLVRTIYLSLPGLRGAK